jgi:hypothetical protein
VLVAATLAVVSAIGISAAMAAGPHSAAPPPGYGYGYGGYGYGYGYENPTPTATPTTTPTTTATPTPTPTPPPPDTKPPKCSFKVLKKQTTRSVRRKGLKTKARCDEDVRAVVRVHRLKKKHKRVQVGRKRKDLHANRTTRITVKLNRKERRRLRHVKKARYAVVFTARDAAGNKTTITRKVTVKKKKKHRR